MAYLGNEDTPQGATDRATLRGLVPDPTAPTDSILDLLNNPANTPSPATGVLPMTAERLIEAAWQANVILGLRDSHNRTVETAKPIVALPFVQLKLLTA